MTSAEYLSALKHGPYGSKADQCIHAQEMSDYRRGHAVPCTEEIPTPTIKWPPLSTAHSEALKVEEQYPTRLRYESRCRGGQWIRTNGILSWVPITPS